MKLSKTQLHKIGLLGGSLGRLLGPLLKNGLLLTKNVLKPLTKSILIPSGLTAAASAIDPVIHMQMFGSGMRLSDLANRTTLIISIEEMNYITKIDKSLEESDLLIKGVSEKIKNEAKKQKGEFLAILLGTFGASLLGNLFTGKSTIRAGERTIRAGRDF